MLSESLGGGCIQRPLDSVLGIFIFILYAGAMIIVAFRKRKAILIASFTSAPSKLIPSLIDILTTFFNVSAKDTGQCSNGQYRGAYVGFSDFLVSAADTHFYHTGISYHKKSYYPRAPKFCLSRSTYFYEGMGLKVGISLHGSALLCPSFRNFSSVGSPTILRQARNPDLLAEELEIALENRRIEDAWKAYQHYKQQEGFPRKSLLNQLICVLAYSGDLKQLEKYALTGMVCLLRQVRLQLSKGDAMWCLLMSDLHVGRASTLEIPVLPFADERMMIKSTGNCQSPLTTISMPYPIRPSSSFSSSSSNFIPLNGVLEPCSMCAETKRTTLPLIATQAGPIVADTPPLNGFTFDAAIQQPPSTSTAHVAQNACPSSSMKLDPLKRNAAALFSSRFPLDRKPKSGFCVDTTASRGNGEIPSSRPRRVQIEVVNSSEKNELLT